MESNWTKTIPGKGWIALRLYAPKAKALDGRWNSPAVTKVN